MPPPELVSRDVRRLLLSAEPVEYTLVRRRGRRGLGLRVDHEGLTVSAPASMPLGRIEAFVRESERWVLRKIAEWRDRRPPPIEWRDGASLPYLGRQLVLRVGEAARPTIALEAGELRLAVRDPAPEKVHRAVVAWYKRAALVHLAARAFVLAQAGGLRVPRVFISPARSRWGSCNARGEVRLAWRLVKAAEPLVDYVVCHELAHLRHMNHSRAFWAEVERLCPDYRRLRSELLRLDHLYRAF